MNSSSPEAFEPSKSAPVEVPIRFRLSRGSYFQFLGSLASLAGSVTVSVILARVLGSEGLGIYAIYVVAGVVFLPLFAFSIPSAVTRSTSELHRSDDTRLAAVLSTALLLMLALTIVGSFALFLFGAPFLADLYDASEIGTMVRLLAIFAVGNTIATFAFAVLQGFEDFPTTSLFGAVTTLANVLLLLVLLPAYGVVGAALSAGLVVVANAGLGVFATLRALHSRNIRWRWSYAQDEARSTLRFAAPLSGASLVARISSFVQNSLVAIFLGFADLGLLRIAGIFFSAILFVPKSTLAPMLPVLTRMSVTRTVERSREIVTQLIKFSVLLILPIVGGLLLALPLVISVLYGPEFLPAAPFAAITILVAMVTYPNAILGEQALLARGRTVANLLVTSYSAGASVGLVLVLLPVMGAMALPVSALATEVSLFAILLLCAHHRREVEIRALLPTLGYLFSASFLLSVGRMWLPDGLASAAAPFAATFLAVVGYRVLMDGDERGLLTETLRRGFARLRGA